MVSAMPSRRSTYSGALASQQPWAWRDDRRLITAELSWAKTPRPARKPAAHDNDMVFVSRRPLSANRAQLGPNRKNPRGYCQQARMWFDRPPNMGPERDPPVRASAGVYGAGREPMTRVGQRNAEIQERNRLVKAARAAVEQAQRV